jgi:hypothetical protein
MKCKAKRDMMEPQAELDLHKKYSALANYPKLLLIYQNTIARKHPLVN